MLIILENRTFLSYYLKFTFGHLRIEFFLGFNVIPIISLIMLSDDVTNRVSYH